MMGGFDFGMLGVGMLAMAVFWVLVIGGAIWLIISLTRRSRQGPTLNAPPRQLPLDVLNARYARGEITKEQFEQMKQDLGADPASGLNGPESETSDLSGRAIEQR